MNYRFLLLFSLCLLVGFLPAQTNQCESNLVEAQRLYREGNLEQIDELLLGCLSDDGFTKSNKADAYKLLCLVSIYEDDREKAVEYMKSFLYTDPEYNLSSTDEPEFVNLYEEFRTEPIFSLGIIAGGNWTFPSLLLNGKNGVHTFDENSNNYSPGGVAFQFGVKFSKHLNKHLMLDVDFMYQQLKYLYNEQFFSEGASNFTDLTVEETQNWISMPIRLAYDLNHEKTTSPYFAVGVTPGFLTSMETSLTRDYLNTSYNENADIEANTDDLLAHRNRFNTWGFLESGINVRIPHGSICVSARYSMALLNQLKANTKYNDHQFMYEFYYIEDDMRLNNLQVFVSYVYKIYKPIIKKK